MHMYAARVYYLIIMRIIILIDISSGPKLNLKSTMDVGLVNLEVNLC